MLMLENFVYNLLQYLHFFNICIFVVEELIFLMGSKNFVKNQSCQFQIIFYSNVCNTDNILQSLEKYMPHKKNLFIIMLIYLYEYYYYVLQ